MSEDRDSWLAWRRAGIGASDIGGILGISPWASPYSVWADKTLALDDEQSEAMELGLALEPAINSLFHARTGLYVCGAQTRVQHPNLPWARATVDGFVSEMEYAGSAPLGTFEAKTSKDSPKVWDMVIPDMYAAQVQWQLFVTGAERAWVGCLHASFGLQFRVYEIERDQSDIDFIVREVTRFYEDHIVTGIPPEADGSVATREALNALPVDPGAVADITDWAGTLRVLRNAKDEVKRQEQLIAECENTLKAALGERTEGYIDGEPVVSWRTQERKGIDLKALRKEKPDVADAYETTTTSRVLRLSRERE